jgi:hypothetical protein
MNTHFYQGKYKNCYIITTRRENEYTAQYIINYLK